MNPLNLLVWGENVHEHRNPAVRAIYPRGMHEAIADGLRAALPEAGVTTAVLQDPEHGLTEERLARTDVLYWWGHLAHADVVDGVVERVRTHVLAGMGLVVLHSAHHAKIFRALMGTHCSLRWREATDKERLWNVQPSHPIAAGISDYFELPEEEMYGEPFGIPTPDELIFISWFTGGEVFRSGATWRRGHGRVFYFRPGHETYPTYHDLNVRRILANAGEWARPVFRRADSAPKSAPLEPLPPRVRPQPSTD